MRYIAAILSSILVLSCSDSPEPAVTTSESETTQDNNNEGTTPSEGINALYGTWVVPCYAIDTGGNYYYSEFTFTSTQTVREDFTYTPSDPSCTSPTISAETTFDATYLSESQVTSVGEAIKTDLLPVKYISTGELTWDSATDGFPDGVNNDYTIYAVSEDKLYFAALSSGEGRTPETRPISIDMTSGFSRK